jgi:hypothetical protein
MNLVHINEGLIRALVLLIVAESVCTLIFEFLFMFGLDSGFPLFVISFTLGGEVNLKGISLSLFTFRYLNASLEIPE